MSERGDIGYMLTASCSDDTNVNINNGKIKVTTGNIKLINDDARLDDNIYTNDYDSTIEVPVKRYIVFDKQSDMEQGEQYIMLCWGIMIHIMTNTFIMKNMKKVILWRLIQILY